MSAFYINRETGQVEDLSDDALAKMGRHSTTDTQVVDPEEEEERQDRRKRDNLDTSLAGLRGVLKASLERDPTSLDFSSSFFEQNARSWFFSTGVSELGLQETPGDIQLGMDIFYGCLEQLTGKDQLTGELVVRQDYTVDDYIDYINQTFARYAQPDTS